jgi:DNA-binding Lrp family transcriptional regulator
MDRYTAQQPGAVSRPPWDEASATASTIGDTGGGPGGGTGGGPGGGTGGNTVEAAPAVRLDETDARIARLYSRGCKGSAIAKEVGLPESTIGNRLFALRREGVIGRRNRTLNGKPVPPPRKLPSVQIRDDVTRMKQAAARLQEKRDTLAADYEKTIALYLAGCGYLRLETLLGIHANAAQYRLRQLKAAGLIPYELPKFDAAAVASIMGQPAKVKPTAAAAEFVCASVNAWPGGPREMDCGRPDCGRRFISAHKGVRRCDPCRARAEGPDMAPVLSLQSTSRGRP